MPPSTDRGADRRPNAAIAWALLLVVLLSAVEGLLEGTILRAGFAVVVVAVALVPPVLARDPTAMVSWEILLLSVLPSLADLVDAFWQPLGYLSVAALAVLVVAEVHAFSSAEMPPWFAALFVSLTTLTVAAAWGMAEYASDLLLQTGYLASGDHLMWDLLAATGVGIGAGLAFGWYCSAEGSVRGMVSTP